MSIVLECALSAKKDPLSIKTLIHVLLAKKKKRTTNAKHRAQMVFGYPKQPRFNRRLADISSREYFHGSSI